MENRSKMLYDFTSAISELDDGRVIELLDLSDDELAGVAAGVTELPDPIRSACQTVLEDWSRLDGAGRCAALLVLANALARAN